MLSRVRWYVSVPRLLVWRGWLCLWALANQGGWLGCEGHQPNMNTAALGFNIMQ